MQTTLATSSQSDTSRDLLHELQTNVLYPLLQARQQQEHLRGGATLRQLTQRSQRTLRSALASLQKSVARVRSGLRKGAGRRKDAALAHSTHKLRRLVSWFSTQLPQLVRRAAQDIMRSTTGWWTFVQKHCAHPVQGLRKFHRKQKKATQEKWNRMVARAAQMLTADVDRAGLT